MVAPALLWTAALILVLFVIGPILDFCLPWRAPSLSLWIRWSSFTGWIFEWKWRGVEAKEPFSWPS